MYSQLLDSRTADFIVVSSCKQYISVYLLLVILYVIKHYIAVHPRSSYRFEPCGFGCPFILCKKLRFVDAVFVILIHLSQ